MSWFNELFLQEAKAALNAAGSGSGSGSGEGSSVADWNTLLNRPFYTEEGGEIDILPQQELAFSSAGNGLYVWQGVGFKLVVGATYTVIWGEHEYTGTAVEATLGDATGVGLGNLSLVGLSGGDDVDFVFGYDPSAGGGLCYTADESASHTVRIYQNNRLDILVNKEVTLEYNETDGGAMWFPSSETEAFVIESGKTYKVAWGEDEFECVCSAMLVNGTTDLFMGNMGIVGAGVDTGEPFLFVYSEEEAMTLITSNDKETTTRTVSLSMEMEVVHTLDEKYLPKKAIESMIDEYMDKALDGEY